MDKIRKNNSNNNIEHWIYVYKNNKVNKIVINSVGRNYA